MATLALTSLASAQAVDGGGSASGTGTYQAFGNPATLTLVGVTGTPQAATGQVTFTGCTPTSPCTFIAVARCIAVEETATGFRASIAGEITGGTYFLEGFRGFHGTVYDNTPPPVEIDQVSDFFLAFEPVTSCAFAHDAKYSLTAGDFTVTPAGACPPNDDDDGDGLTNKNESLFSTLLGNDDSDSDGIADGNDDANGNGEDDEDEDDEDECPDEDSDDDGEDDEDEDDDDDD